MTAETEGEQEICDQRQLNALRLLRLVGELPEQFKEHVSKTELRLVRLESQMDKLKDIPESIDSIKLLIKQNKSDLDSNLLNPIKRIQKACVIIVVGGGLFGGNFILELVKAAIK